MTLPGGMAQSFPLQMVLHPNSLMLSEQDFSIFYSLMVVEAVEHNLSILESSIKLYLCQVATMGERASPWTRPAAGPTAGDGEGRQ